MKLHSKAFRELPREAMIIREKVFVEEQGFTEEFDSVDSVAVHILAYDGDSAIGTCRLFPAEEAVSCILGRLAVIAEYRSKGIGRYLISEAEKSARNSGVHMIKLHSQYRVKDFYEKCGYTSFGEIDYEEDCPHIWMKKIIDE